MTHHATTKRLWTWQHPDWDITSQAWNDSFGREMWGDMWPRLGHLYGRLRRELALRDFIFCYRQYEHWAGLPVRRLWILEVPEDRIHHVVDGVAWDVLVQVSFKDMSEEEAWTRVLSRTPPRSDMTALVEIPIPGHWVKDRTKFNKGPRFRGATYNELPDSIEAALACRSG